MDLRLDVRMDVRMDVSMLWYATVCYTTVCCGMVRYDKGWGIGYRMVRYPTIR